MTHVAESFNDLMATLQDRAEDLERYNRVVSHDMRAPLATLRLNLALMRKAPQPKALERMERTIDRMDARIEAVLDAAHGGSGTAATASVEQVLKEVMADLEGPAREAGLQLHHDPLPAVAVDAGQVAQVFQNLVHNAIKFRHDGQNARVEIRTRRRGDRWEFMVRDHGVGFRADEAEAIIGQRRLRPDVDGHGVGLPLCRRIVARHGGRLRATGRPGKGAAFVFDLPRAA